MQSLIAMLSLTGTLVCYTTLCLSLAKSKSSPQDLKTCFPVCLRPYPLSNVGRYCHELSQSIGLLYYEQMQ